MTIRREVKIRLTAAEFSALMDRAAESGMSISCAARAMIRAGIGKSGGDAHLWREVVIQPRTPGRTLDSVLDWLASDRPVLGNIMDAGGALDPKLMRAMKRVLPEYLAHRVAARLSGRELEDIGREAGISKQAVHQSIGRAVARLGRDRGFVRALMSLFPGAELDELALMEVLNERQGRTGGAGSEPPVAQVLRARHRPGEAGGVGERDS